MKCAPRTRDMALKIKKMRHFISTWAFFKGHLCLLLWSGRLKPKNPVYGNKRPTKRNRWFFIAKLIIRSTCFGHHYVHDQELKSIIQVVAACGTWCFGLEVVGLVWSCSCRPTTCKTKHQVPQTKTTCTILLSS